jgi:hypothetical protein
MLSSHRKHRASGSECTTEHAATVATVAAPTQCYNALKVPRQWAALRWWQAQESVVRIREKSEAARSTEATASWVRSSSGSGDASPRGQLRESHKRYVDKKHGNDKGEIHQRLRDASPRVRAPHWNILGQGLTWPTARPTRSMETIRRNGDLGIPRICERSMSNIERCYVAQSTEKAITSPAIHAPK